MNRTAPDLHLLQPPSLARGVAHLHGHAHCKPPRTMRNVFTIAVCSTLAVAGCAKASARSSGPLAGADLALLHDLPGGNVALIGGNYMKMQSFMQSSLGQLAQSMMGDNKGFNDWITCFSNMKDLKVVGGVALADGLEIRLAFKGLTMRDVDACAKQAGFTHTIDPDHKYVEIDVPGPGGMTYSQGYLVLSDGVIYNRQRVEIGLVPSVEPASRADLEADTAKLKSSNAAGDKQLVALAGKTNRSQTMWFAGSAAGTPVADKIGNVYGSFDIDGGIKADVMIGFTDKTLASKLEDSLREAKRMAGALPPDVRGVLDDLSLKRDGDSVRIVARLSDAQIKSLSNLGNAPIDSIPLE
jgi:hypothetical protein